MKKSCPEFLECPEFNNCGEDKLYSCSFHKQYLAEIDLINQVDQKLRDSNVDNPFPFVGNSGPKYLES